MPSRNVKTPSTVKGKLPFQWVSGDAATIGFRGLTEAPSHGSGVYAIVNTLSGKMYVGSTYTFSQRYRHHTWMLNTGVHHSPHLQNAWNFDGPEAFVFIVLEACERSTCRNREQFWLSELRTYERDRGYNLSEVVIQHGCRLSKETRAKMSKSRTGKKFSPETCAKIAEANRKRVVSESTKAKISQAKRVDNLTEETRRNISAGQRGRVVTEETRRKLSEARQRCGPVSEETRRKMAAAMRGKPKAPDQGYKGWVTRRAKQTLRSGMLLHASVFGSSEHAQ